MKIVFALIVVAGVLGLGAGSSVARATQATVGAYPSGTTFTASGPAPSGAGSSVSLAMPIGGVDDATILVRGAQQVAIQAPTIAAPLQLNLMFAHYVSIGGKPVPDALLPWSGSQRPTEQLNQPLWLQVTVPYGTAPGTYRGSVQVVADGGTATIPITVAVANVTLPRPDQTAGALLTAFNVKPQSYAAVVEKMYGVGHQQSLPALFNFLSSYRISPNNWGYGNPNLASGYSNNAKSGLWWLNTGGQMVSAVGDPSRFASMWIPISSNRWGHPIAGLSPYEPQTWCSYLQSVHAFWQQQGWLDSYTYLWGMDEPGAAKYNIVARQDAETHACFPGGHAIVTGTPSAANKILWNGGSDDVDVWAVLASRYYGKYTTPAQTDAHISHVTQNLKMIDKVRKLGKQVWTYTYPSKAHSTPGFSAAEPLADAREFVDWAALEGISGLLYGEGTTTYSLKQNPLVDNSRAQGSFVLIYPGAAGPIPSARLEEIREGIEDWEILNIVRQRHGAAAVRKLLSGIFSTTSSGAKLGCTIGCALKTDEPYSWPVWSHDGSTAAKLARMRAAALDAAS